MHGHLAVFEGTFLFEFHDRLDAVTDGRATAGNLRGVDCFQQFAFGGAMRNGTAHMGDDAFVNRAASLAP
jgi:hypothetical protein